jgi:hypothetical protein
VTRYYGSRTRLAGCILKQPVADLPRGIFNARALLGRRRPYILPAQLKRNPERFRMFSAKLGIRPGARPQHVVNVAGN